uniref:Uncharacterized protein n=1 Tax=Oryza glaberrima TaxID=4538 RepID=I1Q7H0_ORYGL
MAAAAAVAAAGRAVRYGVLSKALPTRLHINSGRGLDISEAEGPLDRYIQVLMVNLQNERNLGKVRSIEKILSKRDMVRESSESLILERMKKIGTHNTKHAWMVAGVTISGYLFGAAFVALLTESQLPKREEEKEA